MLIYKSVMVYYQNPPDLFFKFSLFTNLFYIVFEFFLFLFFTITVTPNPYPRTVSGS